MKMITLSLAVVALLSVAACKDKAGGDPAAASGTPSAMASTAAATATAAAQVACAAVVANAETLTKVDADGKKMFLAMCEAEPQPVRACMLAAKTMNDFNACDPHPFKDAMKAGPEPTAADLVELDLSTADPAWKGWVAKGPKDAKVMADGVHGARIAANGMNAFDISFAPRKTKLADTKKGAEAGQKMVGGTMKTNFVTDTADKLEWSTELAGAKLWHFSWNMKVSGKDVTCSAGMMGVSTDSMLALLKSSCESLHKK